MQHCCKSNKKTENIKKGTLLGQFLNRLKNVMYYSTVLKIGGAPLLMLVFFKDGAVEVSA
jgi:hypothetical protein